MTRLKIKKKTYEVTSWQWISTSKNKNLNDMNNVKMFTASVRGGKAFAAEQKIRELKTGISKLNAQKLKIFPTKIILNSAINMNNVPSEKYRLTHE